MSSGWFRFAPVVFLLLWSAGFTVAAVGLAYAEPLTFVALRYALVLLVLIPVLAVLRPALPRGRRAWLHLAAVGLLVQFGYIALSWTALARGTGAGVTALIVSLQPVLVALVSPHLGGPPIGRRVWAGLGLGLVGAAAVIASRFGVAAPPLGGVGLAGASLLCMTAGTLYEKRFGSAGHPLVGAAVQYSVAGAAALAAALATETMRVEWTPAFTASLFYLAIPNSLVAITLLLLMVRRGEVARVSALLFLVPPIAAAMAWLLTGEALPPAAWAGMAVAAAGVALATGRAPASVKA